MKKFIVIAWRNLRRNRSRTLLTISAVAFATFFALIMRSFQLGSYDNMINNFIEMSSGFISVSHPNFTDDPTLENTIEQSDALEKQILETKNVKAVVPKLNYFSLGSYKKQTKGIMINGIDTEKQNELSKLSDKIVRYRITDSSINELQNLLAEEQMNRLNELKGESYSHFDYLLKELGMGKNEKQILDALKKHCSYPGEYLRPDDDGVILGDRLAKFLKIETGDTLVLLGTGYRAATAADKFPVRGIIKIANPKLDRLMVYSSLNKVQNFLSAYYTDYETGETKYLLSSYDIDVHDRSDEALNDTKHKLTEKIGNENTKVKTWKETNKELAQQIESDDKSGQMIMGVLYLVIAFGVFGTVLMMTAERKREMGVMIAIGMKKIKLSVMITFELLFLGLLGVLAGIGLSTPLILLGYYRPLRLSGEMADTMIQMGFEPVMPMAWFDTYMLNQIVVVAVIVVLVSFYPLAAIKKLKVSDALRA